MSDNPRPQLYDARYTALSAARADEDADETVSVAGMHCESGDVLIDDVALPAPERGDLLAVPATGAYTLAMSSNYNGVAAARCRARPRRRRACSIRRRETIDDLLALESGMTFRFCDDLGPDGFGWIVEEAMTRTSHALAADGKVWLVDALDWPDAIDRALELGEPAGVIQLLDRHNRDCASLAARLGVPHVVAPDELPGTRSPSSPSCGASAGASRRSGGPTRGRSSWPTRSGRTAFYTGGRRRSASTCFLRLTPPKALAAFEPERVLVGHGEGVAARTRRTGSARRCDTSRRGLPGVLLRLPLAGRR